MSDWERVEVSWYRHSTGAVVQRWNRAEWLAWRPQDLDADYRTFKTRREAEKYALEKNKCA